MIREKEAAGEDDPSSGPSESEFSFALTRIAVAQICQTVGFTSAQDSALKVLTDIAGRYLRAIAKTAATVAATYGRRTRSNIFDIIVALEDLGSVQGFKGLSETETACCVLKSSLLVELQRFVECTVEIPFAKPLPRKLCNRVGMRLKNGGGVGGNHVPRWLPAMPVIGKSDVGRKRRERWEEEFECVTNHHKPVITENEEEKKREEKPEGFEGVTNHHKPVISKNEGKKKGGKKKGSEAIVETERRVEVKGKCERFELGGKRGKVRIKMMGGNGKELRKGIFGKKRVRRENEESDGGRKREAISCFS